MTKYREILRLQSLGFSQQNIAYSSNVSKKTVNRVINRAKELNISWPLDESQTDAVLEQILFPKQSCSKVKRMPDLAYIRKELLKNGVSKKLLWTEYMEECRLNGEQPLMYSQFCYYIQLDEQKHRATMHIPHKPGEQVEVDWAGDPARIIDPDTGEIIEASIFTAFWASSTVTILFSLMNSFMISRDNRGLRFSVFFAICTTAFPFPFYFGKDRSTNYFTHSIWMAIAPLFVFFFLMKLLICKSYTQIS